MNNATTTATKRDVAMARLAVVCARLYDAATPADERWSLSFEASTLRTKIMRCKDPLAAMVRASGDDDDSEV